MINEPDWRPDYIEWIMGYKMKVVFYDATDGSNLPGWGIRKPFVVMSKVSAQYYLTENVLAFFNIRSTQQIRVIKKKYILHYPHYAFC